MKHKLLALTAHADMPKLALAFLAEEEREQWYPYHVGVGRIAVGSTKCSKQHLQPGLDLVLLWL